MSTKLSFTFSSNPDKKPVVFIDDMPNSGTELRPSTLRSIAQALLKAADDCEKIVGAGVVSIPQRRQYDLKGGMQTLDEMGGNIAYSMRESHSVISDKSLVAART